MPDYLARGYFRYKEAQYRVKVFEGAVWVERQMPRAFGGNLPISDVRPDEILYGSETWNLEALPGLLDKYEALLLADE